MVACIGSRNGGIKMIMSLGFLRRVGWFGVIGVVSSAVYVAGVSAGVELFGWGRMTANIFGLMLSTPCSYLGQRRGEFTSPRLQAVRWHLAAKRRQESAQASH